MASKIHEVFNVLLYRINNMYRLLHFHKIIN
jgi:hypothetical protein